jgi:hypothetical protein
MLAIVLSYSHESCIVYTMQVSGTDSPAPQITASQQQCL